MIEDEGVLDLTWIYNDSVAQNLDMRPSGPDFSATSDEALTLIV
jgi:hypothetical protein